MKRPAVFFDRDNTLIRNDGYLGDPAGVVLIDGGADAIARVRQLGLAVLTFSNQSGVARGMFTEDAVRAVDARMDEMLLEQNASAVIDSHEFCPYHPNATVEAYRQESDLRKPKPGMLLQAAERMELDISRSWVIGDAPRDIEAGRAAGCRTILFHDPDLPPSEAARQAATIEPDFIVSSLRRAAQIIARESGIPDPSEAPAATAPSPEPDAPEADASGSTEGPDSASRAAASPVPDSPPSAPAAPAPAAAAPASRWARAMSSTSPARDAATSASDTSSSAQAPASATPVTGNMKVEVHTTRLESLAQQILDELRRARHTPHADYSLSKLFAGIVQMLAIGALFYAYLRRGDPSVTDPLLLAVFLEAFTIALLLMGQQR
jgi:D-glycero-D-manno-heptose 1,7-bisphosphate phosphatase